MKSYSYELHHLKGKTYYIDGPTNLGVYFLNEHEVVLIDCGTHQEDTIIETLLRKHHLKLNSIICTHSHPDHSGASLYLSKITGCKIIASKIERAFFRDSKLDIGFLYGGYPLSEFDNRLMHTDEQHAIESLEAIPRGLRSFKLPGHHYGMIGIKTSDGVYFIADALGSKELISSEHILLIYDVAGYIQSLEYISKLDGILVPSHSFVTTDISDLLRLNRNKMEEIMSLIFSILQNEQTVEEVVAEIFNYYNLRMSYNRYLLITATIRSYIAFLNNQGKVQKRFLNNKLYFSVAK